MKNQKLTHSVGLALAQGLAATAWPKGRNGPTGGVVRVRPRGGHRAPGTSGGAATGGQPADEEVHRRCLRHQGVLRSSPGKEKRTVGSPSSVSIVR
jgi:hypothetical protein